MSKHETDAEILGKSIEMFVRSAGEVSVVFEHKMNDIVEKHLGEIEPESWYSVSDVAAATNEIRDEVGSVTIKNGGIAVAKNTDWPEDVTTVEEALQANIQRYQQTNRGGDSKFPAGNYTVEMLDARSARVGITERFPYGPEIAEGIYTGIAQEHGPDNASPITEETDPNPNESHAWILSW